MDEKQADEILNYLRRIDESINGTRPKRRPTGKKKPLSDRVDSVSKRVDSIDARLGSVEKRIDALDARMGTSTSKVPLAQQIEGLDSRMSDVQLAIATLAVNTKQRFDKVDEHFKTAWRQFGRVSGRFDRLDRKIDGARTELVDHMERIHEELAGRIVDLESPGAGGRGGGPGVPLAS
jgi:chromosome segregation ATPase